MFKSLIAVAAASAFSTPAFAGFYLGVDTRVHLQVQITQQQSLLVK